MHAPPAAASRRALLLVLLAALALRLLALSGSVQMANDGADYLWQAEKIVAGDWHSALRHPYHPLTAALIAAASVFTGGALMPAAWLVAILAGLGIVLAVHGIAHRLFPEQPGAATAAALLAAVHPRTLMLTADIQSDGPFLALFLLATRALVAGIERGGCRRRLALAGALTGLAYLVRPEGLFLGAALALWVAVALAGHAPPRHARPAFARVFGGASLYTLALALFVLPYALWIHDNTGRWGLTMKPSVSAAGLTKAHRLGPPPGAPIGSPTVPRVAPPATGSAPDAEPERATPPAAPAPDVQTPPPSEPKQGALLALPWTSVPPLLAEAAEVFRVALREEALLCVLIGAVLLARRRPGWLAALLLLVAVWFAGAMLQIARNGYLSTRHMLVPALVLLPLGGAGLLAIWQVGARHRALRLAARTLALLMLLTMSASGARTRHSNHDARMEALAWVREQTGDLYSQRIGVHRRKDGWYAQRSVLLVELPCDDAVLLRTMRETNTLLLVLDLAEVLTFAPHWLDGRHGLIERARFGTDDDAVVILSLVEVN